MPNTVGNYSTSGPMLWVVVWATMWAAERLITGMCTMATLCTSLPCISLTAIHSLWTRFSSVSKALMLSIHSAYKNEQKVNLHINTLLISGELT